MSRIVNAGAEAGIEFKFDTMQPGNTFDAHRLVHLAQGARHPGRGRRNGSCTPTFFEGEADRHARSARARSRVEAGLDATRCANVLDGDAFAEEVRIDERVAQSLGVTGVPFFLIDDAYGVPGAQDPEVFLNVLRRAWARPIATSRSSRRGDVCDDGACDI